MKTQEEVKAESKALIVWFILEMVVLFLLGFLFVTFVGSIDIKTMCLGGAFAVVNSFFRAGAKSFLTK